GKRPDGIACYQWRHGRKTWRDSQVHKATKQLSNWCSVFPANPRLQGDFRTDSPVIGNVSVVRGFSKILISIAESDGARVRNAEQKIGKVRPGNCGAVRRSLSGRFREGKRPSRILLGQIIELLPAEVTSKRNIVALATPQH